MGALRLSTQGVRHRAVLAILGEKMPLFPFKEYAQSSAAYTLNESPCLQALSQVQLARKSLAGAGVAAFLALVAFLGRGSLLLSAGPVISSAAAVICAVAFVQLQKLENQFIFTDWVNHEKH